MASQESGVYSDTTLSAAAVFSAKIFGVMNWAFLLLRSTSVTPRATEHFPQTKIGTLWAITAANMSFSGGIATGMTAPATSSFIR